MSAPVSVKRLESLEELEAIGPLWKELQDGCAHQHVLMDHRWVSTWWRHFGKGKAQHTLLLSSGRAPIGIVPLAITHGLEAYPLREPYIMGPDDYEHLPGLRWRRLVPLRRLTFPLNLITGNIRGQAIFPCPEPSLYSALTRYAAGISGSWDVATLPGMRSWEQENTLLAQAARGAGLSPGMRDTKRPMLYVDLPSSYDEFMQMRSAHFRRHMRQECNKIERTFASLGPMRLTCFRGPDIPAGVRRMFALETKSWKVSDEKDRRLHLSLGETAHRFFQEVSERFAADDNAQIIILSFGETDAAAWFTLERGGVSSCVLTYRNEQLGAPVGIAPVLQELVSRCIASGLKRLDINGYTRHYLKWAKDHHDYSCQVIFNGHPYSRLLHLVDDGAVALGRRLFSRKEKIVSEAARPTP